MATAMRVTFLVRTLRLRWGSGATVADIFWRILKKTLQMTTKGRAKPKKNWYRVNQYVSVAGFGSRRAQPTEPSLRRMSPVYIQTGVMETRENTHTSATAAPATKGVRTCLKRMGWTVAK